MCNSGSKFSKLKNKVKKKIFTLISNDPDSTLDNLRYECLYIGSLAYTVKPHCWSGLEDNQGSRYQC